MPDANSGTLRDLLGRRDLEVLFSLYRYFEWADDMRKLYRERLRNSPVGEMKRAGATEAAALERLRSDQHFRGQLLATLYAFPYMSHYYGGMYVVVEAWKRRFKYRDPEIDTLLRSALVDSLKRHRNASFHFTPEYFDDRLLEFVNDRDSERWLNQLHAAFARWFRYHFRLAAHEGPQGMPTG